MRRDPHGGDLSEQDPFWRWPVAVLDLFESSDDRAYGALVQALARQLASEEAVAMEMDSTARRPMEEIKESGQTVEAEIQAEARRRVGVFRAALEDAFVRSGGDPRREASYDSADPGQDQMADVLIQYLVRTNFAQVRTTDRGPGQYVYALTIAWDRLRHLAEQEGHPLPLWKGARPERERPPA
jgi:hypothetical protein